MVCSLLFGQRGKKNRKERMKERKRKMKNLRKFSVTPKTLKRRQWNFWGEMIRTNGKNLLKSHLVKYYPSPPNEVFLCVAWWQKSKIYFWYQNYWKLLKDIQVVYCVFASSVDSITIWAVLAKIYNGQKGEYFIRNQMPVTCMNNKIILVIVQKTTKKMSCSAADTCGS